MFQKTILLALPLIIAAAVARAQTEKPFIRTSIVAGIGASQIDGDEIAGYTKPGAILGAAARFAITDKLAFQPEVLYAQKGARSTEDQLPVYIRWRVNYVQVPVLLSYDFLDRFTALGGASAGYLLGAKLDGNGTGFVDFTDEFNRLDLQYIAGLEVLIADWLSLNMRLEYSMVPAKASTLTFSRPFYNNTIAVSLRLHLQ